MKKIRKQIEYLVLLFASLILLQSCVVYQKTNVSLEQAVKAKVKTKVITKTNETYKFHRIRFEDGKFYGVTKKTPGYKKSKNVAGIPLENNEINKVLLKDIETSILLSVGLGVIITGGLVFAIAAITFNPSFEGMWSN